MSASLVGSEMCIRDSFLTPRANLPVSEARRLQSGVGPYSRAQAAPIQHHLVSGGAGIVAGGSPPAQIAIALQRRPPLFKAGLP
eukprot:7517544-Alexandrium_andersonii.AAC.1